MTLKRKIAINISIAYSLLYGISALLIYLTFSSFRKEEFMNRLEEKALTTTRLLFEIKQIDRQLLKLIDQNTINKLYNEKTLVFDEDYKLIYSSIDDASISWNITDLKRLKDQKKTFKTVEEKDVFGIFYDFESADYYVLIAAEDKYGHTQLAYLLRVLIISFFVGAALVWFSTYAFIRKQLKPLDEFQQTITNITANRLSRQLPQSQSNDEINLLTKAFNEMLRRIDLSFKSQKEFTANASHELRTPVTRLTLQLENLIQQGGHPENTQRYLDNMWNDLNQITDLIQSLLLLAKTHEKASENFTRERIDEIIFEAYDKVKNSFADFHMIFEIAGSEAELEIQTQKALLDIVFINLLRNAYLYSEDKKVTVVLRETPQQIQVSLKNIGHRLEGQDPEKLFEPFVRGNNAGNIHGSGLGLRIAKRILDYHSAGITYVVVGSEHEFEIRFKK